MMSTNFNARWPENCCFGQHLASKNHLVPLFPHEFESKNHYSLVTDDNTSVQQTAQIHDSTVEAAHQRQPAPLLCARPSERCESNCHRRA